ncbi:MAG: hypothetical protein RL722_965 [Pseudomonadota bacterium]|jgi:uncharacterized coiled-coil protein SlyX
MRDKLTARLDLLRAEYANGQQTLHELERQATEVRETLLRISGAVQVLQEALSEEAGPDPEALAPALAPALPARLADGAVAAGGIASLN